ncbi:TVP38/TMEM64 family protein [Halobacillus sp. Marseille-Q1614]|uniref:TVP38/TMEM64 family protein n=1 Tax=Halobacillus sp. Marseille-Q1614 TaxID=2709134 RepID=UPI00156F5463|nr:VTT domain-containing protein [Halobacillus sp. Marseille-Q1614]
MSKRAIIRGSILLLAFVAAAWFVRYQLDLSPREIRLYILSYGWWGPLIFIGLYTLGPFIAFPTSILSLAAAFTYGVWPGILFIVIGASGAAVVGFVMGKWFGHSVIKIPNTPWMKNLYARMEANGFLYVLTLRLIPIIGFNVLSYAAGIAKVRWISFITATMIGLIPGTLAYSLVGSSLAEGDRSLLLAGLSIIAWVGLIIYLFRKKVFTILKLK